MKNMIENIRIVGIAVLLTGTVYLGIMMQGCSNEEVTDKENMIDEIAKSMELEDFIMADIDLRQSLETFEKELSKVNFANLETVIENGKKVTYLPETIRALNIEDKTVLMNEKKETLLNKYPQLLTLDSHDFADCINRGVKQSIRINEFLLEKKINIYRPLLKSVIAEYEFDTINQLVGHLYNWTFNPDYVEAHVFFFTDGTYMVALDDRNTPNECNITIQQVVGVNKYYYNGKEISTIAHTHRISSNPSKNDSIFKAKLPYCSHAIYYNAGFWSY